LAEAKNAPDDADAADTKQKCPRCGGLPAPRKGVTRSNPFLPKTKHLTCNDCGLDYTEDGKPFRP